MGEEAKQEETKVTEAPKQEEKAAAEEKEEKKEEEKPSSPPPPTVLFVELHCVGCAKKIERTILKCRGVEEVETKMEKNEVTVKGKVDPQALCALIQKKTSRKAKVLSPLPPPDAADSTKTQPPPPPPPPQDQACGISTVELLVNMHCEACAQQLRKKIMKMGGVQAAETDQNAKKVTVTGTINAAKLVEYIYRRTGKIATIIPPSPPPPPAPSATEEKKDNGETKTDNTEKLAEEKKENNEKKSVSEEAPKAMIIDEEMVKRMMYWNGGGGYNMMNVYHDDEMSKRMMMMHDWMPMAMPAMPMHTAMAMPTAMVVFDRPQLLLPPPQMFSDENPNACSIS